MARPVRCRSGNVRNNHRALIEPIGLQWQSGDAGCGLR
jgi:hypothetical protein